jgi:hypothetical protein
MRNLKESFEAFIDRSTNGEVLHRGNDKKYETYVVHRDYTDDDFAPRLNILLRELESRGAVLRVESYADFAGDINTKVFWTAKGLGLSEEDKEEPKEKTEIYFKNLRTGAMIHENKELRPGYSILDEIKYNPKEWICYECKKIGYKDLQK